MGTRRDAVTHFPRTTRMNWTEAQDLARGVAPKVTLKERPHYLNKPKPEGAPEPLRRTEKLYATFKSYEVFLDGKLLGWVENCMSTSHRMAGRLIARTFRSKKWEYNSYDVRRQPGSDEMSRKAAIEALITHLIYAGKLTAGK